MTGNRACLLVFSGIGAFQLLFVAHRALFLQTYTERITTLDQMSLSHSINVDDPRTRTHSRDVAALGLFDWEHEVIEQGTCHLRPPSVSASCCLGTFN